MKCENCGSNNIEKGILQTRYTVSAYRLKENDKARISGCPTRCEVCLDCGTIVRIYIDERYLNKFKE